MADLTNVLHNISTAAQQADAKLTAAAAPIVTGPHGLLLSFAQGTNVLDLVTGQNGVVIGGKRENVVIPSA